MSRTMILAAAVFAAGCSPQAPKPEVAAATPVETAKSDACAKTPIASVCVGPVSSTAELLDPKCVWTTQEVKRSENEVLLLNVQDCKAAKMDPATYAFTTPKELHAVWTSPDNSHAPYDNVIADVFDIPAGKTAQDVAMTMLSEAPAKERARCVPKADAPGGTFQLAPDAKFLAELEKDQDGIISACGPYGFTQDSQVFWEAHGTHAIFHSTGQDTPSWDPNSFVFYTRDASGAWVKEASAK